MHINFLNSSRPTENKNKIDVPFPHFFLTHRNRRTNQSRAQQINEKKKCVEKKSLSKIPTKNEVSTQPTINNKQTNKQARRTKL